MSHLVVIVLLVLVFPPVYSAGDENVWKDLMKESHTLHQEKQYNQAIDKVTEALDLAERSFGTRDIKVATTLKQLAYIYSYQRRYQESVPLLRRAVGILEERNGLNHPEVAKVLSSLARHLGHQKKREEAEKLYARAVDIRERTLGPEHLDLAYDLMSLARYAQRRQDYTRAESLHTRALKIRTKHLDPDHGWIAESWAALARLYQEMKRYEDAVAAQRRALAIKMARHGAQHRYTQGYRATLNQMRSVLTRHQAKDSGSTSRTTVTENPTRIGLPAKGSSKKQHTPASIPQRLSGDKTPIHVQKAEPLHQTTARLHAQKQTTIFSTDWDHYFMMILGGLDKLKMIVSRISPVQLAIYLFVAIVLFRMVFRSKSTRQRKDNTEAEAVQDMNIRRRKLRDCC